MTLFRENLKEIRDNPLTRPFIKPIEETIKKLSTSQIGIDEFICSKLKDLIAVIKLSDGFYYYEYGKLTGIVITSHKSALHFSEYMELKKNIDAIRVNIKGD